LTYQDSPVAFCAVLPHGFIKDAWRVTRFVVLPKFQSCGIGLTFLEAVGNEYIKAKMQFTISTRHIAVIKALFNRKNWYLITAYPKTGIHSFAYKHELKTKGDDFIAG
jgi:hypothetical protein